MKKKDTSFTYTVGTISYVTTVTNPKLVKMWTQKPESPQAFAFVDPYRQGFASKRPGVLDIVYGADEAIRIAKTWRGKHSNLYPVFADHFKKWPQAIMSRVMHEVQRRR